MKHLKKFNEGFLDFFRAKDNREYYYSIPKTDLTIVSNFDKLSISNIDVLLQPKIKIEKQLVDPVVQKVVKICNRWELYIIECMIHDINMTDVTEFSSGDKRVFLTFDLSDQPGDGGDRIPDDIKRDVVEEIKGELPHHKLQVEKRRRSDFLRVRITLKD